MTKRIKTKTVEKARAIAYMYVARHFRDAARDAMDLEYWTAAGVLIVHAAIAYSDALSIQNGGVRSTSDDHEDAITLLEQLMAASDGKAKSLGHLRHLIEEKTKVSYLGELYTPKQTREMWKKLDRFQIWAEKILNK